MAAALLSLFKLVILPIIGIAFVSELQRINWIASDDPMAVIVLIVTSGTPSATVQIYLTTMLSDPEQEELAMNCLALSLIVQYLFVPITLTIAMTYTLKNLI